MEIRRRKDINMDRYSANKKIFDILAKSIDENRDMRFIQILWALGIINSKNDIIEDRFYEESEETLKKINTEFHKNTYAMYVHLCLISFSSTCIGVLL